MSNETTPTKKMYNDRPIKVMGIGNHGRNAVNSMIRRTTVGLDFICAHTNPWFPISFAYKDIHLDAANRVDNTRKHGKDAAEITAEAIKTAIDGAYILFIITRLGDCTGGGAATMAARIAKAMGILAVVVVTKPFEFERSQRLAHASEGLAELQAHTDTLIVVSNKVWLKSRDEGVSQRQSLDHVIEVGKNVVKGFGKKLGNDEVIGVSFEEVLMVLRKPGISAVGMAGASGPNRASVASHQATVWMLEHLGPFESEAQSLLELSKAKGLLVLITAPKNSLKLAESKLVVNNIQVYAGQDAQVVFCALYDEALGDGLRVMVVATGLYTSHIEQK